MFDPVRKVIGLNNYSSNKAPLFGEKQDKLGKPSQILGYKFSINNWRDFGLKDYSQIIFGRIISGASYTGRHFSLAKSAETRTSALAHRVVGVLEAIPVVGSVIAIAERFLLEKPLKSNEKSIELKSSNNSLDFSPENSKKEEFKYKLFQNFTGRFTSGITSEILQNAHISTASDFFNRFNIEYNKNDETIKYTDDISIEDEENRIVFKDNNKKELFTIFNDSGEIHLLPEGRKKFGWKK